MHDALKMGNRVLLRAITVVRGNADKEWAEYLPESATVELFGNKIYVIHNKGKIFDDLVGIISYMLQLKLTKKIEI